MAESKGLPEILDGERQKLITIVRRLVINPSTMVPEIETASSDKLQELAKTIQDRKKEMRDNFKRLIEIKEVIEGYLDGLLSDVLDGKDILESLQRVTEVYPFLREIRRLVQREDQDLTGLIQELELEDDQALQIVTRWSVKYEPLDAVWWEIFNREQGRENPWTSLTKLDYFYNEDRHIPQIAIQLSSRRKVVWNAREDVDDIGYLADLLLRSCLAILSGPREERMVEPDFQKRMNEVISRVEETVKKLKALRIVATPPDKDMPATS